MTAGEALRDSPLPRNEALQLLAHATGRTREALLASPETVLDAEVAAAFRHAVERRARGEPIAYLVGHREFHGHRFSVDAGVLIPRPETELLVDLAIERLPRDGGAVLDLGTGSGAVAISLALACPGATVVGTDQSSAALAVARANGLRLRARVEWLQGDWYEALGTAPRRFDLVVSNPPYIAAGDPHLGAGDLRFEPPTALTDGGDGLAAIRRIVAGARAVLVPGGLLLIEHGHDQAAAVRALLAAAGYGGIESARDLAGIERVASGRLDRPSAKGKPPVL